MTSGKRRSRSVSVSGDRGYPHLPDDRRRDPARLRPGSPACARFALGRDSEKLIDRFRFLIGVGGGPPGLAVSRAPELVLARDWELRGEEHRLLRTLDAGSLVLLPLTIAGRTIGALYADSVSARPPSEPALAVARQMRDAVAAAMGRGQ